MGLLVLLGIEEADGREDIEWLAKKIVNLRIFPDEQEVMNKSLLDVGGELLLVYNLPFMQLPKRAIGLPISKQRDPRLRYPCTSKQSGFWK